jgi:hypothetical protein
MYTPLPHLVPIASEGNIDKHISVMFEGGAEVPPVLGVISSVSPSSSSSRGNERVVLLGPRRWPTVRQGGRGPHPRCLGKCIRKSFGLAESQWADAIRGNARF